MILMSQPVRQYGGARVLYDFLNISFSTNFLRAFTGGKLTDYTCVK